MGAGSLFIFCVYTVLKLLRLSYNKRNNLHEKMYYDYTSAGLLGLLTHRFTCSFESVPTLWFLLGLSLLLIEEFFRAKKLN